MKSPTSRIVGRKPSTSVTHSDRPSSGALALMTTFCSASSLVSIGGVDERGDLGLEPGDRYRLGVARRVEGRLAVQLALDGVGPRADLLDVSGPHLVDEERLVWHPFPLLRSPGHERDHKVQRQERGRTR